VKKNDAQADRDKIYTMIANKGGRGMTNDEISDRLGKNSSFYSPRLIELERSFLIVKINQTRKTRGNRKANIYVHPGFVFDREIIPVKQIGKMPDPMIEEADKRVLSEFLERVSRLGGIVTTTNCEHYNAIKRLAGV